MRRKSFIGLSIESHHIVAVKVEKFRDGHKIVDSAKINIAELLNTPVEPVKEQELALGDDLFGFQGGDSSDDLFDTETKTIEDFEEFNLETDDLETESVEILKPELANKAAKELFQVLDKFGGKKIEVGISIPLGDVSFTKVTYPADLKNQKRKLEFLKSKVCAVYGVEDVSSDNFKWVDMADNTAIVASTLESSILLELLERLNRMYTNRIFVRTIIPEEVALLRFLKEKKADETESAIIIAMGKEGTRIIFTKDNQIYSAVPIISMKKPGLNFINTVFSRIMMELEKGQVNFIDRFYIYDRIGMGDVLIQMLSQNFEGIESVQFTPFPEAQTDVKDAEPDKNLKIATNGKSSESPNLTAPSAAVAASGTVDTFAARLNFVPRKILERQKVFKLKWHGVLFLFLIAILPLAVNYLYQDYNRQAEQLSHVIDRNAMQIAEFQPIQSELRALESQISVLESQFAEIEELGHESLLWSQTLSLLSTGFTEIRNTWITSLQYTENGFVIEGMTLFRERIPEVANLFNIAGIQRATVTEVRGRDIFQFTLIIDSISDTPEIFNPVVVIDMEEEL